jgi:predicted permease
MLKHWLTRLRILFSGNRRREVDEELQFHLEQQVAANIAAGMPQREARRQAMIAFGSVERTREQCREQRPGYFFETLLQDIRYSLRGLRRSPSFTVTLILTLMLGIGATTAVFSVVDRILFRSLPYAHADSLVSVGLIAPIEPTEFMLGSFYYEWRDNQAPFASITSETGVSPCDLTEESPARLSCAAVAANFLPTFGITPLLGRNFTREEDRLNAPRVALISYALWHRRFNADPGALDKLIHLDGQTVRIIGVLPKDFEMPTLEASDVVVPEALDEAAQRKAAPDSVMYGFARLKPGVSIEQAKAALQPEFDYSLRLAPAAFRKEVHLQVRSLRDRQVHDVRLVAWILLGVVLAVLLIACANVSNLLMARGAGRDREIAVRSALGATQTRLIRQALTESIVVSLAGAAAGCAFAELLLRLFVAIAPEGIPFLGKAQLDIRIMLFTLLLSLLCGVLFGLVPALAKPRREALAGRSSTTSSHARLRQSLVVVQIMASMVLLVAGALLLRSFWSIQNQSLGMHTESVVTATFSLGQKDYPTRESQMAFFQQLSRQLQYGPGVTSLAISDSLPPGGYHQDQIFAPIVVAGRPRTTAGTGGLVTWRWVTPDYFHALDIPLVQGAGFTEEDLSLPGHSIVLSRSLASRLFPGQDPIGQRLQLHNGGADDPFCTVVGVAADVKNGGLTGDDEPEYYKLRRNDPADWDGRATIIVKTSLPADVTQQWIRSQVAAIDPTEPVDIETLSARVSKLADQPRFESVLVGFFAMTGLILAVVGLYGVISFLVVQRTQEIGVRMALGADRIAILRLVLGRGLRLIAVGTSLGLLAAFFTSRILGSLLFSVGPHDPGTFAIAALLLVMVAILATFIPARAATKVDPIVALRCD